MSEQEGDKGALKGKEKTSSRILNLIWLIYIIFLLIFCFHPVSGSSMYPTYEDGQISFCTRIIFSVQSGDVVIAKTSETELLIKRVVGTPGDTVLLSSDGNIYVNGEVFEYGHGSAVPLYSINDAFTVLEDGSCEITLGEGEYVLIGDNRENSADSRYYGVFKRRNILQKVIAVF